MTGNRSLDEFAGSAPDEDDDGPEEATTDGPATTTESPEAPTPAAATAAEDAGPVGSDEPAPPASTYVWTPDGGPCGACGEAAEARWRDGDALVCADCKAW